MENRTNIDVCKPGVSEWIQNERRKVNWLQELCVKCVTFIWDPKLSRNWFSGTFSRQKATINKHNAELQWADPGTKDTIGCYVGFRICVLI